MSEHDLDELRRRWGPGRGSARPTSGADAAGGAPDATDAPGAAHVPDATDDDRPPDVHDAAARPDLGPPPATARPFPLPPPAAWNADDEGPGSPRGSIRPPDTTGTVDAPLPGPLGLRGRGIATGLVGALVGAVLGTAGTLAVVRSTPAFTGTRSVVQAPVVTNEDGTATANVVPAVAQAVTPSVVRIDVLTSQGTGDARVTREIGLGSGVIYRSDGYILTNNHVVEDANELRVRLANGDSLPAELIGTDPLNDLAVLRVDRTGLPAINLREEPAIVVGETAIAIGSPFGLDASVTAGVVSAINRDIQVPEEGGALVIPAVVQTDAAINPGNSGGALVDASGRLIGINTAILSATGGSQGVGFAIPVSQAVASAEELIEVGFVRHPFLGITGVDLTPEVADEFDLDVAGGAVVDSVQEGSAADRAGLEQNDIIVALNGEPIESMSDLVVSLRRFKPDDVVTLDLVRDGEELRVEVTLDERPR
ncbi:MAG: trypsin-like peptidase domain-containing protein [Actinobacteria bacterium]|nr:trypsin-like peptidase domain-containing protein [Actinomycetota bacterium]